MTEHVIKDNERKKNLQDSRIVFNARRISILNNGKCVTAVKRIV